MPLLCPIPSPEVCIARRLGLDGKPDFNVLWMDSAHPMAFCFAATDLLSRLDAAVGFDLHTQLVADLVLGKSFASLDAANAMLRTGTAMALRVCMRLRCTRPTCSMDALDHSYPRGVRMSEAWTACL